MEKNIIQKLTKFSFVIWLLSVPFSYVYSLTSLEKNKGFTSFSLYNVYLIDVTTIFLLTIVLINLYLHKKSFFAYCRNAPCLPAEAGAKEGRVPTLIFAVFTIISFFWSGSPFLSAFWGLRFLILILALYATLMLIRSSDYYKNTFLKIFITVGTLESLIALGQFIFQQSLGLHLLGESRLDLNILGLARVDLLGHDLLRAYGTFPHPNILGGFLLFTIVATIWYKPAKYQKILLLIQIIGLGLTFSRSAILGFILIILLGWKCLSEIVIPAPAKSWSASGEKAGIQKKSLLLLFLVLFSLLLVRSPIQKILSGSDETINIRWEYAKAAYGRFLESPVLGRGWGTGPVELPAFSKFPFYSWELQPVHNIYLLVLSDLGIMGLLIFLYFIYRVLDSRYSEPAPLSSRPKSRDPENALNSFWIPASAGMTKNTGNEKIWEYLFIAYLFIGLFDHYLLTLPQGIFIFFGSALLTSLAQELGRKKGKNPAAAKKETTSPAFE